MLRCSQHSCHCLTHSCAHLGSPWCCSRCSYSCQAVVKSGDVGLLLVLSGCSSAHVCNGLTSAACAFQGCKLEH